MMLYGIVPLALNIGHLAARTLAPEKKRGVTLCLGFGWFRLQRFSDSNTSILMHGIPAMRFQIRVFPKANAFLVIPVVFFVIYQKTS